MAEKNIDGFVFDDTKDLTEILNEHRKFTKKQVLDEKDKETQKLIEQEKAKWELEQQQQSFVNSLASEQDKKLVDKLLKSGMGIDEIRQEFPDVIKVADTPKQPEIRNVANVGAIVNDIAAKQQSPQAIVAELEAKGINNLTEAEQNLLIINRALLK